MTEQIETVELPPESADIAELRAELAKAKLAADQAKPVEDAPEDVPEDAPAQQREAMAGYARGYLDGQEIEVPPVNLWRSSAMRALNTGDFETWAEKVLPESDYETWTEVDPNMDQINEFFESLGNQLGTDRGNSRASRRSSQRTRRR